MGNGFSDCWKAIDKNRQISCKELQVSAQTGDLFLMREKYRQPQLQLDLDPGLMRGINATQLSNCYSIEHRTLPGWTRAGVFVRVKEIVYLLEATIEGIRAVRYVDAYNEFKGSNMAIRKLHTGVKEDLVSDLTSYASNLIEKGPIQWSNELEPTNATLCESFDLKNRLLQLVRIGLQSLPLEQQVEVQKAFFTIDTNGDGSLDDKEIKVVAQNLESVDVVSTSGQISKLMTCLDSNSDGKITLDEFMNAISKLPRSAIPQEFDLPGLVSGALVASCYEHLNILDPIQYTEASHLSIVPILPCSFSPIAERPLGFKCEEASYSNQSQATLHGPKQALGLTLAIT